MIRSVTVIAGVVAVLVLLPGVSTDTSETVYARQDPQRDIVVTLDSKGSHPKIGIQSFIGKPALAEPAGLLPDVLGADLAYEREFYVIDRKASAALPAASTPESLPFAQWVELGADFVLMGWVRDSGDKLDVDIKLVNVKGAAAGKVGFAQSYGGCTLANPRFCAHSIADDMHQKLRGLAGVARTRIAFTSDRDQDPSTDRPIANAGNSKEIYLMDYDGGTMRPVTRNKKLNIAPSWGPDGRTLAYTSYASDFPDIYLVTLDGRAATRPAQGTRSIHNQNAAISPDGNRIAFTSSRSGQTGFYDIWVVNRDGSNLQNLTPGTDKSSEGAPTWSPDGHKIAFTSDRTGTNQIYIMNSDGTLVTRMTFQGKCDRPAWSPLGYIAYTLERSGGHDIGVMDLARNETRVLTDGTGSSRQPTIAPNGRHIAFVTTRWGGTEQIATIDYPDGKGLRRITTSGNNRYPNWSPTPGGK